MQDDTLNAFVTNVDKPVANADSGPLSGATLAVKDIFDVEGYPTGCGNPEKLAEAQPAAATAAAVKELLDAGARFVGKTQTDELAFSLTGDNVHYPQPVNPRGPGRVTGGSSSGSAAAVSGGLADIATGSDTGGSIRAPASYCGLIGLRTTHDRISLAGTMPLAPSFDTFGWFARDGALYEAVANVLLGEDRDQTPLTRPLRLPLLDNLIDVESAQAYSEARTLVEQQTRTPMIVENFGHDTDDLYWCFRNLQAEEAWRCHRDWLSVKDRKLGPGTRQRLEFGESVSNETVANETERRVTFRSDLNKMIGSDGYIVMPTVPGPAPLRAASFDEQQAYRERALRLLCLSGLSGFPQITLPLAEVDGAPFGLSLLGPPGRDRTLISLGRKILKAAARDG